MTVIAIVGASEATPELAKLASAVGCEIARRGAALVCGGRGGVMEAACAGARSEGGVTIGLLPGSSREEANRFVSIAIPTGMGEMRNALIVRACDAMIAVGGAYGTLSEIALALQAGKRVVGLSTWEIDGIEFAAGPAEAVDLVIPA